MMNEKDYLLYSKIPTLQVEKRHFLGIALPNKTGNPLVKLRSQSQKKAGSAKQASKKD